MVDTKCSFPNGKYKKSSLSNPEAPVEDESLLMQPIRTSYAGFKEAKKAFENGTDEVRQLLMEECSLIYECNVCRNMFRSLANFFGHKRQYCKSTIADNFHSFPDQTLGMLIQTAERSGPLLVKSRSTGCSPIPNNRSSNRDLSKVIERLKRVDVSSESVQKASAKNCKTGHSSPEIKATDSILELERVPTSTFAVYQTLKNKTNTESIRTELDEVHSILENRNVLLGPDGKTITAPAFMSSAINSGKRFSEYSYDSAQLLAGISCEICNMPFQTEKTLKMHVQKNHNSTTYVFQCPKCSMTFLQPAAVIRHLANEHKKPLRRIRKMRDTILKKRIQIGDIQIKGMDREVKRLQMTNTKDIIGSKVFNEQNGISVSSCSYCFKNFERRAVLATHLVNCLARKTSLKNTELSKGVSPPNDQNIEAKIQNQNTNPTLQHNQNNKKNNEEKTEMKANIKQEPKDDLTLTDNSSSINKLFENLENQTFGNGLHTVCLENIQMTERLKERNGEDQSERREKDSKDCDGDDYQNDDKKIVKNGTVNKEKSIKKEKTKRFRIVSAPKQLTCRCKICNKQFNALSNLRRHISMFHYRSKRFGCNFCDYRAFRRYDIVNHLTFVHKMIGERESMAVEHVTVHETKYSKDDVEGDIVVVTDEAIVSENVKRKVTEEPKTVASEIPPKANVVRDKSKNVSLQPNKDFDIPHMDSIDFKVKSHVKVVRRKLKKTLETQAEGKKRPIRNRIKTVNKDFVYDLLTIKEEPKQTPRLAIKRSNSALVDQNNFRSVELTPPPIKIIPYRLRTEPLMPAEKSTVRGVAAKVFRRIILEGLAAPSTLPELPTERPQMRSRLISSSRSDSNPVPIIETSELEAAGLKSTFFDDSFLEKFAKKSNPSFKMKPLLAMHHSPLNSILQKFDASQQNNEKSIGNKILYKTSENNVSSPPNYSVCLPKTVKQPSLYEKEGTPNGKQIDTSLPPATPKKRITLMERLAENRAKIKDSLIRTALEN